MDEIVAAASEDGVYRRARLMALSYEVKNGMEKLTKCRVFFVDCGFEEEVLLADISQLPEQFSLKSHPAAAIRVVVCGVVPGDKDLDWCHQALMHLSTRMEIGCHADK